MALDLTERQVTQFSLFNIWQKFSPFYIWWNFHSAIFGEENFRSIFGENQAKPCIIFICHLHCRSKCGFKTEGWNGKERKEGGDSKTFENGKRKQQDFSHLGNGQWEKDFSYQLFFPEESLEKLHSDSWLLFLCSCSLFCPRDWLGERKLRHKCFAAYYKIKKRMDTLSFVKYDFMQ